MTDHLLNDIAHARGVLEAQAADYRWQRDQAVATLEFLVAALDGDQGDIDAAIHGATLTLHNLKERS